MRKFYPRKLGLCLCGNKGYKIMANSSVCYRCHKIEKWRKFSELYNQTTINNMADKIRADIEAYRRQTIMYLE